MKKYILSVLLLVIFATVVPHAAQACSPCNLAGDDGSGLYANDAKKLCGVFTQETFGGTCGCSNTKYVIPEGWRALLKPWRGFEQNLFGNLEYVLTEEGKQSCNALGYTFISNNIGKPSVGGFVYDFITRKLPFIVGGGVMLITIAVAGLYVVSQRMQNAKSNGLTMFVHQKQGWRRLLWTGIIVSGISGFFAVTILTELMVAIVVVSSIFCITSVVKMLFAHRRQRTSEGHSQEAELVQREIWSRRFVLGVIFLLVGISGLYIPLLVAPFILSILLISISTIALLILVWRMRKRVIGEKMVLDKQKGRWVIILRYSAIGFFAYFVMVLQTFYSDYLSR